MAWPRSVWRLSGASAFRGSGGSPSCFGDATHEAASGKIAVLRPRAVAFPGGPRRSGFLARAPVRGGAPAASGFPVPAPGMPDGRAWMRFMRRPAEIGAVRTLPAPLCGRSCAYHRSQRLSGGSCASPALPGPLMGAPASPALPAPLCGRSCAYHRSQRLSGGSCASPALPGPLMGAPASPALPAPL